MTDTIIERTNEIARLIARAHDLTLTRIIVYGSHAHGEATERSDIDLVLVSPDWEDVDYYARPEPFLIEWPRDELPTPDIIPVTPAEFAQRSQNETDIVRTAVETGIVAGLDLTVAPACQFVGVGAPVDRSFLDQAVRP